MNLPERLKTLRKQKRMTQTEVANALYISQGAYSRYEMGTAEPNKDAMAKLAALYDVTVDYLIGVADASPAKWEGVLPPGVVQMSQMPHHYIPMMGSVAAGVPIYMSENYDVYIDSPREADFALTIRGDSMSPTYLDGDVVYIKAVPDVDDGQVCVVAVDDDCTLKHLYHIPGGIQLISDNPAYKPMTYTQDNSESVRVLGVPVGFTRLYRRAK